MVQRVELPDGSIGEFPDGMTDDAITGVLQKQFPRTVAPPTAQDIAAVSPANDMAWHEKALVGAGAAMDRTGRALSGLLRGSSTPDEDAELYKKYHPGGWATAGEIGADLAMSAAPVAAGAKRASQVASMLRMGRAAPLVGDVAANAAYAAATAPDDRGEAAMFGAAGAAGGRVLNRAVGGIVRPTANAQELLDRGVRLTPGQAGGGAVGSLARMYEDALGSVPGFGRGINNARQTGLEDWNRAALADASSGPLARSEFGPSRIDRSAPIGQNGIVAVKEKLSKAYESMFPAGTTMHLTNEGASALDKRIESLSYELPENLQSQFVGFASDISRRLKNGVASEHWKEVIEGDLDAAMKAAFRAGDNSLVRALKDLDRNLLAHMRSGNIVKGPTPDPSGVLDPHVLTDVDAAYRDFKVLKKAGERAGAIKRGGVLYPSDVAVEAAKRGATDLQERALAGQQMLGNAPAPWQGPINAAKATAIGAVGGMTLPGGIALTAAAASLLGTTELGRKVLLGQYPLQKLLMENPEFASQLGRALATPSEN
jgi:hypothetical protein